MSDNNRPSAKWVSAANIPAVFGISPKEIQRAYAAGVPIRRRYWGRKPLYSADDIDAYINSLEADK